MFNATHHGKFKRYTTMYEQSISFNSNKPIEKFINNVLPYRSQIQERDEEFFLKKSFQEEAEEDSILDDVMDMKDIWHQLTKANQRCVFEYVGEMINYGDHYFKLAMRSR